MTKRSAVGEVRRGQLITTYGVGAIIAVQDESVMVAGIDRWPVNHANLHEPRLERLLSVPGFATPPATEEGQDIPVVRFPELVWCSACKRLDKHKVFTTPDQNRCRDCGVPLVPSRFVIVCSRGHIDDFPYHAWVHFGKPTRPGPHHLTIEAAGSSASLRDIVIKCSCDHSETLEGAFQKTALQAIAKCKGRRPWLINDDTEPCGETPRTLQRGASNVWFSVTHSAISIPPWSEGAHKLLNKYWPALQHVPSSAVRATLDGMGLAERSPYTVDDLVLALQQRRERTGDDGSWTPETLRVQEYEALVHGKPDISKEQDFVCEPVKVPAELSDWFERVMVVKRLREVVALQSFTRIEPPSPTRAVPLPPIADVRPPWLPAIEVLGEGVFIKLREDNLQSWETRSDVQERIGRIDNNYTRRFQAAGLTPDRAITPRLALLHTLAHALINEWSLDSGYPAASLRERLYASTSMAGLLIYTASSDSAGSLGGLIGQGEPTRLRQTVGSSVARSSWCSSDPICIETTASGVDALNLAACHACLLLPEVSCEESNRFLDRAVLVGAPGHPALGWLAPLSGEV